MSYYIFLREAFLFIRGLDGSTQVYELIDPVVVAYSPLLGDWSLGRSKAISALSRRRIYFYPPRRCTYIKHILLLV